MHIHEMAIEAYATSQSKGFHDGPENRNIPTKIALIHAELSEALEDHRAGNIATTFDENGKPHGFAQELADIAIRLGDLAELAEELTGVRVDLESEIIMKLAYNKTRPVKHGNKKY